jgi:hypothetical protein
LLLMLLWWLLLPEKKQPKPSPSALTSNEYMTWQKKERESNKKWYKIMISSYYLPCVWDYLCSMTLVYDYRNLEITMSSEKEKKVSFQYNSRFFRLREDITCELEFTRSPYKKSVTLTITWSPPTKTSGDIVCNMGCNPLISYSNLYPSLHLTLFFLWIPQRFSLLSLSSVRGTVSVLLLDNWGWKKKRLLRVAFWDERDINDFLKKWK